MFRTVLDALGDDIGALCYLSAPRPDVAHLSGIQQNHRYGQDNWAEFTATASVFKPESETVECARPQGRWRDWSLGQRFV